MTRLLLMRHLLDTSAGRARPHAPAERARWTGLARCLAAGLLLWGAAPVAAQVPLSRDPAQLRAGRLLYATPGMGDARFAETVILLIKHGRDGSMGVVINQPSEVSLRKALPNLPDARRSEVSVYWGGPVEPEASIVLLREPGTSRSAERVLSGVYISPDIEDLRAVLAAPRPDRAVRVYSGYAGWSPGQLASEMQKGQWVLDEGDAALVFSPDPTPLWERVHEILKRREARTVPGVPSNQRRGAFARVARVLASLGGRPPSRPLARDASAFTVVRLAPTRAATLTISTFPFPVSEKRATRTRASGRLVGWAIRYALNTARMARSAFACESAAAYTGNPGT